MTTSRNPNLLAPAYVRYLSRMPGISVEGIFHPDEFEDYYNRSILNKLLYRVHPPFSLDRINAGIRKKIETFRPGILWIFKGMEIYPDTLKYAKKKGVKLVNYNPDHPFEFEFRGSGNRYIRESLQLYDLHFSYSRAIIRQLKQQFGQEGTWLPFGYDLNEQAYQDLKQTGEENKICFVGYADRNRAGVISQLVKAGLPVDVYGPGWNDFLANGGKLNLCGPVQGMQFWTTLRRYRIQLNIFRKQNKGSHNMRSFEIPAAGGLMLAPYSSEQADFFEEGKEVFFYKNPEEMIEKARWMLSISPNQSKEFRANARNRCTTSGYSYCHRAEFVAEMFKKKFPDLAKSV